jgi:N6-adenosine-specific RNA methylase IME4
MTQPSRSAAVRGRASPRSRTARSTPTWPTPGQAGAYRAICADPPWHFQIRGRKSAAPRGADEHYPTLDVAHLHTLPVAQWAAPDCHLFLWTTGPHLPQAIRLMEVWGWRYSGLAFCWVKLRRNVVEVRGGLWGQSDFFTGLGYTTRHNVELVLLGRRGEPVRLVKDVRELVISPVREHSRKPDEIYRRIERYAPGPRLELFARGQREGWDCWGNEATGRGKAVLGRASRGKAGLGVARRGEAGRGEELRKGPAEPGGD